MASRGGGNLTLVLQLSLLLLSLCGDEERPDLSVSTGKHAKIRCHKTEKQGPSAESENNKKKEYVVCKNATHAPLTRGIQQFVLHRQKCRQNNLTGHPESWLNR